MGLTVTGNCSRHYVRFPQYQVHIGAFRNSTLYSILNFASSRLMSKGSLTPGNYLLSFFFARISSQPILIALTLHLGRVGASILRGSIGCSSVTMMTCLNMGIRRAVTRQVHGEQDQSDREKDAT
jgi:hypothetical protein